MVIRALLENTSKSDDLKTEHGLSVYIETQKHKLLFDTGASGIFAENAKAMGVNLAAVDTVAISHGHFDHGGGIATFLKLNAEAKVYLRENAFSPFLAVKPDGRLMDIGLDTTLLSQDRFVLVGESITIDDELQLFSNVRGDRFNPAGNKDLLVKEGDVLRQDDFSHEQNLIVKTDGKTLLLAGCAHSGIVNILERYRSINAAFPDVVIGGFHLFNPNNNQSEEPEVVAGIGRYLLETGAKFYTCHCTGIESYKRLKDVMGGRIAYLSAGDTITL